MVQPAFSKLLPRACVVVEAAAESWDSGLLPEEQACVRYAVARRRREFTAGRNCARTALRILGIGEGPILVGRNREPLFPQTVSGTITHTDDYCAAAVIRKGHIASIGIDAEKNDDLPAELMQLVLSREERLALAGIRLHRAGVAAKLAFSIKEAFFKAYYQVRQCYLDFQDARVTLLPDDRSFVLHVREELALPAFVTSKFRGCYALDDALIYSAVAIEQSAIAC